MILYPNIQKNQTFQCFDNRLADDRKSKNTAQIIRFYLLLLQNK